MSELKPVGAEQEASKMAVAEATASEAILPATTGKNAETGTQPGTSGIQARWTGETPPPQQGSSFSAILESADRQDRKSTDTDRAESLPEALSRSDIAQPYQEEVEKKQQPSTKLSAAAVSDLIDNPAVKERREDLTRMQVALGGSDAAGAAAFDPHAYKFGHLPSTIGKSLRKQILKWW